MPLIGAFGNASEYAYRGFAGLFPDPFDFVDLSNVEPGNVYYSNFAKITGMKIPFPIQIDPVANRQYSLFASVFGNGNSDSVSWADNTDDFSFSDDLDTSLRFISNPSKIKDNQSVVLKLTIPSYSGSPAIEDASIFGETFQTNVSIGNSIQDWLVTVRDLDRTVNPFTFTNVSNSIAGVAVTTNQVIISGLEDGFNYPAEILTNNANLTIDAVGVGTSGRVENGSVITLDTTSSTSYSATKTVNFRVSGFTTSWQVTTEPLDLDPTFRYFEGLTVAGLSVSPTITAFSNVTGALFSTQYSTGQTRGLIEAVEIGGLNVGLTTNFTVTGGEAQLIRKNNSGIYTILNPYGAGPLSVKNEDLVSLRTTSSADGSTATNVDFSVGTGTGQWRVTTQAAAPAPDPAPDPGPGPGPDPGPTPISFPLAVTVFVVGGGGGGGLGRASSADLGNAGGGGGGGQVNTGSYSVASGSSYTITVGEGGAASNSVNSRGGIGGSSSFIFSGGGSGTFSSGGGGGGTGSGEPSVRSGGSTLGGSGGGGGAVGDNINSGGDGSAGGAGGSGGNAGGSGAANTEANPKGLGGGGGGAGGAGTNGSGTVGGTGGQGVTGLDFFATNALRNSVSGGTRFAGGGGGGSASGGLTSGAPGQGGGGDGAIRSTNATNGASRTGAGGGGGIGRGVIGSKTPGSGGSGVVVIKYSCSSNSLTALSGTTQGTVLYDTTNQVKYHYFTTNSTITFN